MIKTLKSFDLKDKNILIRTDFNVPMVDFKVANNFRIKAVLPTIKTCLDSGSSVTIMSHLGRPKGKDNSCSLQPVSELLGEVLNTKIGFLEHGLSLETLHQLDKKLLLQMHQSLYHFQQVAQELFSLLLN